MADPATPASLTGEDYRNLSSRWIDIRWADAARLRRVDRVEGAALVGGDDRKRDHQGIYIPYFWPVGIGRARGSLGDEFQGRLRRDHPEQQRTSDGRYKDKAKYLTPPGDRNKLYFPPDIPASALKDTTLPVLYAEGEFKALAARRLASHESPTLRFLPLGIAGAWNWQGKIGKVNTADGTQVDEYGPAPDHSLLDWKERKVILAFDMDARTNAQVKVARASLRKYLLELGASVGVLEWPLTREGKEAKGLDDWLHRDGPEVVIEAIAKVVFKDGSDWQHRLLTRDTGFPKPLVHNALVALEHSPEWMETLQFDVFRHELQCSRRPWGGAGPWEVTDNTRLAAWLQANRIEVSIDTARSAARTAARQIDPLKDYVEGLHWDGTPRLDRWLIDFMGVRTVNPDGTDITNYVCAVGTAWLVGGIARALQPGSQMDYVLVFCGNEGLYKSSAMQVLSNGWFTDSLTDVHGDEPMRKLQGIWIVEFAEIEAWRKAEAATLRGFITRRDDKYRALFEDNVRSHLRRNIFSGTHNGTWIFDSEAENRRYWPVSCMRPIDIDGLRVWRHQLWAEARERWEAGALPYLQDKLISEMASNVREAYKKVDDPWVEIIHEYIDKRGAWGEGVSINEILLEQSGVNKDKERVTSGDSSRIASVLKRLGFESRIVGRKRLSRWYKTEE